MKIGILEVKRDEFMTQVVKKLRGHKVSYIRLRDWNVPLSTNYKVVVDRLSYDNELLRELLKNYSTDGAYVINNPFTAASTNKIMDSKICSDLGIPIPPTRVFPIMDEEVRETVSEPNWEHIKDRLQFPVVFKPFDGYGGDNVYFVHSAGELKNMYNAFKNDHIMLVQNFISKNIYRFFCVNKTEMMIRKWNPPQYSDLKEIEGIRSKMEKWTVKLNKALDLDFNTVEWSIGEDGEPYLIDAFNDVPLVEKWDIQQDGFDWVVDRFSECILEKAAGNETNSCPFPLK